MHRLKDNSIYLSEFLEYMHNDSNAKSVSKKPPTTGMTRDNSYQYYLFITNVRLKLIKVYFCFCYTSYFYNESNHNGQHQDNGNDSKHLQDVS